MCLYFVFFIFKKINKKKSYKMLNSKLISIAIGSLVLLAVVYVLDGMKLEK